MLSCPSQLCSCSLQSPVCPHASLRGQTLIEALSRIPSHILSHLGPSVCRLFCVCTSGACTHAYGGTQELIMHMHVHLLQLCGWIMSLLSNVHTRLLTSTQLCTHIHTYIHTYIHHAYHMYVCMHVCTNCYMLSQPLRIIL